jgi:eukaryotic-like serine/threonine-protein kinase
MEYVQGQTLEQHLADRGQIVWVDVVRYAIEICDALQCSHDHGVIHRDLKPSNLMVTQDDTIKLTDFGIAKDLYATALTASFLTLGTARYMSPEQFRGAAKVSHKTDLYALGVVMYEMLTGELPFQGATVLALMNSHMNDPRPKPSDKTCIIPIQLDKLVPKLMAKSTRKRPLDAAAVALELRGLLARREEKKKIDMFWADVGPPKRRVDDPILKKDPSVKKKPTWYDRVKAETPTLGLVFSLVAIGALMVYLLWWPSAEYLHDKAKRLMASEDRADWLLVPKYYLDDLDRWYPDHQFKAETDDWRDRIALSSATHRADVLEGSPRPKPAGQGEVLFVAVFRDAEKALEKCADADAARLWREMAARLEKDGAKSERGWLLLANGKAAKIEAVIAERANEVATLISQADAVERAGLPDRALEIRRDLITRFEKYADTAEAVKLVRTMLPADKE